MAVILTCTVSYGQDLKLSIVGNEQSVPGDINRKLLESVMRGEKLRWEDGASIKIALMKTNTPVGSNTCKKIYSMSGNELNKYFLALVFQGKVKAPAFFNSQGELLDYVVSTPGAIGVIESKNNSQGKLVLVDGQKEI